MFGTKPLIERLADQQRGFPPPVLPGLAPEAPQRSMVDSLLEPPPYPVSISRALDRIAAELGALLKRDDPQTINMMNEWSDFRGRLESYLDARKGTRMAALRVEDEKLTRAGREVIGKLDKLQRESAFLQADFNNAEAARSDAQVTLQSLGSGPDRNGTDDPDESFVLPEEQAEWSARRAAALVDVETQGARVRQAQSAFNEKQNEISSVRRELGVIKQQRRRVRDELRGRDVRGPHALQGRVGHTG